MIKVYRNLNKKCWSVKINKNPIVHFEEIKLKNCTFHVQQAGREKVLKHVRKNVHAYVKGEQTLTGVYNAEVSYNPYLYGYFYHVGPDIPVYKATFCWFTKEGRVYYS